MFYNRSNTKPGDIFVFGSNTQGRHDGGAARCAVNEWGAEFGKAVGIQGDSYAIPTINYDPKRNAVTLIEIEKWVDEFLEYAKQHPENRFLVTEIGCGIAGWSTEQIGPMFMGAPDNVVLPDSFKKCQVGIFQE